MSERRISHYRITGAIGKGGMGEVYAAEDETLQRKVALKSIRSEFKLEPELRARFLREARVLSQLDHPNICRIFDYVSESEGDYIVLEHIEGVSLERTIAARVPRKQALSIALEITDALAAAHAAGVVHRDIKPGNVIITTEGVAKVLDFGLSRVHGDVQDERAPEHSSAPDAASHGTAGTVIWKIETLPSEVEAADLSGSQLVRTMQGRVLGTLRYMSPEQARGELVTAASDMYALGLVLQELFTGEPAHDVKSSGEQVLEHTRQASSAPVKGLPRDLTALITSLKSPEPALRPTAHEVLRRLRWIQDKPRRWLRRAVAASVLVAAAIGATKYTFDLRRERGRAEGRTAAGLEMTETLIQQLVPVLEEVGRLDAFNAAAEGIQAYFAAMPREELTDGELVQMARLLILVGRVRESQGRPQDAQTSFAEALAVTTQLEERLPHDSKVILARGEAHFYLGQVALRGLADPARALECFRAYHAAAQRNEAVDPDPVNAVRELTYARNAIVGTLLALDRAPEALAEQADIVRFLRERLTEAPNASDLRDDLADNLSWLGSAHLEAGDVDAALAVFEEELGLRRGKVAADRRNAVARARLSYCLTFIARVQLQRAQPELAVAAALEARDLLAELHGADPKDTSLAESLCVAMGVSGEALHAAGRGAEACEEYARCLALGEELLAQDPQSTSRRTALVEFMLDAADTHLLYGPRYDDVERLAAHAWELSDSTADATERERARSRADDLRERAKAGRDAARGAGDE